MSWGQNSPFPIDFARGPYRSASAIALPVTIFLSNYAWPFSARITSTKEVIFSCCVCLSLCLSANKITRKLLIKSLRNVVEWLRTSQLD